MQLIVSCNRICVHEYVFWFTILKRKQLGLVLPPSTCNKLNTYSQPNATICCFLWVRVFVRSSMCMCIRESESRSGRKTEMRCDIKWRKSVEQIVFEPWFLLHPCIAALPAGKETAPSFPHPLCCLRGNKSSGPKCPGTTQHRSHRLSFAYVLHLGCWRCLWPHPRRRWLVEGSDWKLKWSIPNLLLMPGLMWLHCDLALLLHACSKTA